MRLLNSFTKPRDRNQCPDRNRANRVRLTIELLEDRLVPVGTLLTPSVAFAIPGGDYVAAG